MRLTRLLGCEGRPHEGLTAKQRRNYETDLILVRHSAVSSFEWLYRGDFPQCYLGAARWIILLLISALLRLIISHFVRGMRSPTVFVRGVCYDGSRNWGR